MIGRRILLPLLLAVFLGALPGHDSNAQERAPRLGMLAGQGASPMGPLSFAFQLPAAGAGRNLIEAGVDRPEVTIGEPFQVAIRIVLRPGMEVEWQELRATPSLEMAGPIHSMRADDGGASALYPLVAWRTALPPHSIEVRVREGEREYSETVPLPLPTVRSVLPLEDSLLVPRPAKELIDLPAAGRLGWCWPALGAVLLLAAAAWLARGFPPARAEQKELITGPREWALAEVSALIVRAGSDPEARSGAPLIEAASRVLRSYLHRVRADWSPDLTSSELLTRMRAEGGGKAMLAGLADLLGRADRVKFMGRAVDRGEPRIFLALAHDWIATYPAPGQEEDDGGEEG